MTGFEPSQHTWKSNKSHDPIAKGRYRVHGDWSA